MAAFEGSHYGIEVKCEYLDEDRDSLKQIISYMEESELEYKLLPFCGNGTFNDRYLNIIKYMKGGKERYCIINGRTSRYFTTEKLPDDMDIHALISDVENQWDFGEKPWKMKTKFQKLYDAFWKKAFRIFQDGKMSKEDKNLLPLYIEKEKAECKDEWELDDVDGSFIIYKIMADLLKKESYEYQDMEYFAKIDPSGKPGDLFLLKTGYEWRKYLGLDPCQ